MMMSSACTTQAIHLARGVGVRRSSSSPAAGCNRRDAFVVASSRGSGRTIDDDNSDDSDYSGSAQASAPNTGSRRALLGGAALTAAASIFLNLGPGAQKAFALYNKDLDIPITDPVQAVATVFGGGDKKGGVGCAGLGEKGSWLL